MSCCILSRRLPNNIPEQISCATACLMHTNATNTKAIPVRFRSVIIVTSECCDWICLYIFCVCVFVDHTDAEVVVFVLCCCSIRKQTARRGGKQVWRLSNQWRGEARQRLLAQKKPIPKSALLVPWRKDFGSRTQTVQRQYYGGRAPRREFKSQDHDRVRLSFVMQAQNRYHLPEQTGTPTLAPSSWN